MNSRQAWSVILLVLLGAVSAFAQQQAIETKSAERAPISGTVLTRDGEPVGTAYVSFGRIGSTSGSGIVKVEANGSFKSEPLEAGIYRIFAGAPGYISDPQTVTAGLYHPGDTVSFQMIRGGVITGKVTNADNAPVIAAYVRAIRVKDQNGKPLQFQNIVRERMTDDRGIYRLYSLVPGSYVVSAGGPARFSGGMPPTQYEQNAPTYSPASTRDAALEVTLNNGDELTMDIQYRGEPGHAVSGAVAGLVDQNDPRTTYGANISLIDVRTRTALPAANASSFTKYAFAIYGVPDGEYEITAAQNTPGRDILSSPPTRITVQGADVTGINLTVMPAATIEGRVVLEPDPKNSCAQRRAFALRETLVAARRFQSEAAPRRTPNTASQPEVGVLAQYAVSESTVDGQGAFNLRNLQPGIYKIDPREPAPGWYFRLITLGIGPRAPNVARDGINLKASERVSGLTLTLSEGAGQLRGRISLPEGQSLPSNLRVYLVPAEKEHAENVLRFYEGRPEANGSFTVNNLAPGKYWLLARLSEENEVGITKSIRLDSAFRARAFTEAEAGKKEIAFKPCEHIADYDLSYSAPAILRQ